MNANEVINGKWGRIWVNGELWAECKSFEGKVVGEWEDISFCEEMGNKRKLIGFSGEGTMVLHKMYTRGGNLLAEGFKTGIMPDIKIVSKLADPAAKGHERVEILQVTFDEFTLMKFEDKSVTEEELPFKFGDYNYLDKIA
ncbi:hypothetical protein J2Z35_001194 [Acetoanaerobium pronyense]|uniref:Terminase n=1 Tax=Acetoanaerobium pronyense TaxID=1482736 RepID=A0ABS4KHZ5_9FIRM|nr:phage tail tube protein [Acetoanaerobium pronyense]MBP2027400.1 hypothetical protein [Acetoanaerobium pronyense]